VDPRVAQPLAAQPVANADLVHQIDRPLFQHAGTHTRDDIVLAAILEDDRVDPTKVEQLAEHQPGGSGADDGNLGAEAWHAPPHCIVRRSGRRATSRPA
jgi:hypothetical protein